MIEARVDTSLMSLDDYIRQHEIYFNCGFFEKATDLSISFFNTKNIALCTYLKTDYLLKELDVRICNLKRDNVFDFEENVKKIARLQILTKEIKEINERAIKAS